MKLTDLKNRKDIGSVLNAMGLTGRGAEIGVAFGENAKQVLDVWHGKFLYLIDPWEKQPEDQYYRDSTATIDFKGAMQNCIERLEAHRKRIILIQNLSDDAARAIPDDYLDFCYIDGNHAEPQVSRDLNTWWPKVKKGGIFGGHDMMNNDTPDYLCEVKSAVDRFAKENNLIVHETHGDPYDCSWFIQK